MSYNSMWYLSEKLVIIMVGLIIHVLLISTFIHKDIEFVTGKEQ